MSEPGAADDDPFQRIGHDVADILRAANRAAESSQTRAEAEAAETLAASRTEAAEIVAEAHALREQARRDADEIVHEARARADRLIGRLQSHESDARAHIEAAVGELTQLVAELEAYAAEAYAAERRAPGSLANDDAVIDLRDGQPSPSEPTGFAAGSTVEPDEEADDDTQVSRAPDQPGTPDRAGTAEVSEATAGPDEGDADAEAEGEASAEPSSSADAEPVERAIRSGVARAVSGFLGGERRPRPRREPPDDD